MNITVNKEITLNATQRDVELKLEAELCHGGIGFYEFWGAKCYDRGGLEIDEITFDETGFSADEIDEINNRIENQEFDDAIFDKIADKMYDY